MFSTSVPFAQDTTFNIPQGTILVSAEMFTNIEQAVIPASAFIAAPFNLTLQPFAIVIEPGVSGGGTQLQAFAEAGSYWTDSVEAAMVFAAEAGSYWLDSVEAAIAESGSYWLDSVVTPTRYSSTQVTLQGSAGMTNIFTGNADDANVALGDIGFDFRYYEALFRTNVFVGSNSYLTFGFGSTEYLSLSRTNPLGKTLHLGSMDRGYQNVFVKASADSFRVRYEGSPGTGGASSRFLEITFFPDGAMMVVKNTPDNNGLWTVTKGDGISFTDYAPTTETSFVIMPNTDFTAYTVQPGSYLLNSAVASPVFVAETGVYWLDSVEEQAPLQAETTSWISRVQGLGGQPTTTGQAAIDAFFVAIKSQSYYSKLKLLHLFAGTTTIASAMAPLLHPSNTAATIIGFAAGDYTASGAGAGIQGNLSGYIDHNFSLFANLPGSDAAIGTFSKTDGGFDVYDVGFVASEPARFEIIMRWSDNNFYTDSFSQSGGRLSGSSPGGIGLSTASRTSATDFRYFRNETQIGILTATVAPMPSSVNKFLSFAADLSGSFSPSPRKLALSFAATGMTPAEVSHFSTQVNTTLIGAL